MVDTQRTVADLISRLPDNITGQISAQDVRDLVETLRNGHGEIWAVGQLAVVTVQDVWLELTGPGLWTETPDSHRWSMPNPGHLRYNGIVPARVHVAASMEVDIVTGANKTVQMAVGVNSLPYTPSVTQQVVGSGTAHESTALHAAPTLNPGDYLSLLVLNHDSLDDINVDFCNIFAMDMAM